MTIVLTMPRGRGLDRRIMDLLWEKPHSFTEIVGSTGASREGVRKALARLAAAGLVEKEPGRRGRYRLTDAGLTELHDRRADKLVYDGEVLPLLRPIRGFLTEFIRGLKFLEDLPAPVAYRARMMVSEDLELRLRGERAFFSHVDFEEYSPLDTLESITAPIVNRLVWGELLDRLFHAAARGERLEDAVPFRIRLALDIDVRPSRSLMRRIAALLALRYIFVYEERSTATCLDVMRCLEGQGFAPRGFTKLLERASCVSATRRGTSLVSRDKEQDWEAARALARRAFEILREEGMVREKDYGWIVEELGEFPERREWIVVDGDGGGG